MNAHDVEKMLTIPKQTLLYYEKMGFIKPKRNDNNYRNYCSKDIDKIKYVQLLRSFDIPIKDIQLIFNKQLTIKDALQSKKEYISNTKIKLDNIDNKIKDFIKRKKVKISFEDYDPYFINDNILYFNNDKIIHFEDIINLTDITSINISMCSSQGGNGTYYLFRLSYYLDLDIYLYNKIYSFQIMNNTLVKNMFDYFNSYKIKIIDPLDLNKLYHENNDHVALNKYINRHFNQWAKEYNLDNPRDNYYDIQKEYLSNFLDVPKEKTTIKYNMLELLKTWYHLIKNIFNK